MSAVTFELPCGIKITTMPGKLETRILWDPKPPYTAAQVREIDTLGIPAVQDHLKKLGL